MTEQKKDYMIDALSEISDTYVAEAAEFKKPRKAFRFGKKELGALAACAAALVVSVAAWEYLPIDIGWDSAKSTAENMAAPGAMKEYSQSNKFSEAMEQETVQKDEMVKEEESVLESSTATAGKEEMTGEGGMTSGESNKEEYIGNIGAEDEKQEAAQEVTQEKTEDGATAPEHVIGGTREDIKDASLWGFSKRLFAENMNEINPVMSPVSAYIAMGMAGLGAAGDTLQEFEAVMGRDMHEVSARLMETLPVEPTVTERGREIKLELNLANSIWMDDEMEPKNSWLKGIDDTYKAQAFSGNLSARSTMKVMNDWIEEKTNGLIKKFLTQPLPEDTRMALVNTVYFFGEWQQKFDKESTYEDTFIKADGSEKKVEMMHDFGSNRLYVTGEGFDGAVLPYRDGDLAFVALKPTAGQTVRELYESLTKVTLEEVLSVEETTLMNLKLPKFEVTFDMMLNESLQNMGIQKAFDGNLADFSDLGTCKSGEGVFISLVQQKAVVKLDEEGTEAAAATMVMKAEGMAIERETPVEVFFDEPFLYMIVDRGEMVPVFVGIMDCPQ